MDVSPRSWRRSHIRIQLSVRSDQSLGVSSELAGQNVMVACVVVGLATLVLLAEVFHLEYKTMQQIYCQFDQQDLLQHITWVLFRAAGFARFNGTQRSGFATTNRGFVTEAPRHSQAKGARALTGKRVRGISSSDPGPHIWWAYGCNAITKFRFSVVRVFPGNGSERWDCVEWAQVLCNLLTLNNFRRQGLDPSPRKSQYPDFAALVAIHFGHAHAIDT
ncbi:uncharacterized protein EDB91DRAFT_1077237 [Suillus paluster]|uniref:uncharacterized protein n=1 Tax=Suillus paluster TaxID=48578 RepID=UPI001B88699D|nr:uncharacterized protein EDB91DRAFT_1077237 [Suillus paluster]KAG1755263.1 hypothetical protein EDB91DRAFT_1077237 [Suillus paluster]